MLSDYNIENLGVKISDKADIFSIEPPFIAHIGNDFVIVEKISEKEIGFIQSGKHITVSIEEFNKMWAGNLLIAETTKSSQEPEYKKYKKEELFQNSQKMAILSIVSFLLFFAFILNKSYLNIGAVLLFILSALGAYIGYLLVLKQLHIRSDYADKICSLFKQNDCNNILESKVAKLFGVIGWSEVGFGYFAANLIIISFLPALIPCLAIINSVCLPYSFWSVWYQKFKAKQWCPLCLVVLSLLWGIFLTNFFTGLIVFSAITFQGLLIAGGIYLTFVLSANISVPIISKSLGIENIRYEINSIKANEEVFAALLKKQPRYEVDKSHSQLLMGNPDSDLLVTVFSNPHCNPCSRMHERINNLLKQNSNICVQYILSSFNKELEVSNRYLIGAFQQKNDEAKRIYDEWFASGKNQKERFFENNPIDMNCADIEKEFALQESWKERAGLRATPTILVNGYKLPDNYKIEDLKYFSEIEI
jgi:glutaredoxin